MILALRHSSLLALKLGLSHRTFAHAVDRIKVVGAAFPEPILDSHALTTVRSMAVEGRASLSQLLQQYRSVARAVLDTTLAYEPSPQLARRIDFDADDTGVVLLTHVMDIGEDHKVTFCSGFAVQAHEGSRSSIIVSCAHTLEEMQRSKVMARSLDLESTCRSGSLVYQQHARGSSLSAEPVAQILASLPRSDLILFAANMPSLHTLPISPYPSPAGTRIRAHFVSETRPAEPGWRPWIHGTWRKWVRGRVLGYRDHAGREARPGTYDTLSHLLFDPPPLPGSSGGPIVSEESGSVVGIVLGSRMDNTSVEGMQGWGVPSEAIYEMFKLPGLQLDR
ncbi:hypothetical protein JB92DRAFT_3106703 [Gautieria morchelliformis]|nr:hypothetical protein JB92DRAFT_3106703 [Gautieria morchelliformis]